MAINLEIQNFFSLVEKDFTCWLPSLENIFRHSQTNFICRSQNYILNLQFPALSKFMLEYWCLQQLCVKCINAFSSSPFLLNFQGFYKIIYSVVTQTVMNTI